MGLAYVQPAMGPHAGMPEGFPQELRDLITLRLADDADVARHVVTSDPLVDATLQEGPAGAIVTLTSFRNEPIATLTVSLPGLPNAKAVTSTQHGPLEVRQVDGVPTVSLPLDIGDFLVVD